MHEGCAGRWEVIAPTSWPAHLQMAVDEVLLDAVASGRRGPTLRFWEWSGPAVILGSHQSVRNEVDLDEAGRLGFLVARRMSGGGAMIVEPARTVTYSIYAPRPLTLGLTVADSYLMFDDWLLRTLRELGLPARQGAAGEVMTPLGKLAGSAQARRHGALLHHTTMAYAIEPSLVTRLLRIGREELSPAGVRSAGRRVAPFTLFSDVGRGALVERMHAAFARDRDTRPGSVTAHELAAAHRLAEDKYGRRAWIERLP